MKINKNFSALAGVAQLVGALSCNQRFRVQFPIRAHAWVESSIPGLGMDGKQPIDASLSHQFLSLPSSSL